MNSLLKLQANTKTILGQGLDLITPPPKLEDDEICDFSNYTQQQYDSIVKWKTAFYSFSLPIRAALYLVCIDDKEIHDKCEKVLIEMGHFFQIQVLIQSSNICFLLLKVHFKFLNNRTTIWIALEILWSWVK